MVEPVCLHINTEKAREYHKINGMLSIIDRVMKGKNEHIRTYNQYEY